MGQPCEFQVYLEGLGESGLDRRRISAVEPDLRERAVARPKLGQLVDLDGLELAGCDADVTAVLQVEVAVRATKLAAAAAAAAAAGSDSSSHTPVQGVIKAVADAGLLHGGHVLPDDVLLLSHRVKIWRAIWELGGGGPGAEAAAAAPGRTGVRAMETHGAAASGAELTASPSARTRARPAPACSPPSSKGRAPSAQTSGGSKSARLRAHPSPSSPRCSRIRC